MQRIEIETGESFYIERLKVTLLSVCSSCIELRLGFKGREEEKTVPRGKKIVIYSDMSHYLANIPFSLAEKENFYCVIGCLYRKDTCAVIGISAGRKTVWKEKCMNPNVLTRYLKKKRKYLESCCG